MVNSIILLIDAELRKLLVYILHYKIAEDSRPERLMIRRFDS